MMRRAQLDAPLQISLHAGDVRHVPAGPLWVLERPHWIALMWTGQHGHEKAELPFRDYAMQVSAGHIRFAAETAPEA